MVTFCDILHEAKQKTKTNSRECAVRTGDQLEVNETQARLPIEKLFGFMYSNS